MIKINGLQWNDNAWAAVPMYIIPFHIISVTSVSPEETMPAKSEIVHNGGTIYAYETMDEILTLMRRAYEAIGSDFEITE